MRLRACLTSGLPAYLAEAGWPHCCSARAFHGAHAPATRSPRHQNGCEAEPGTCWGMLRANHLVNRHEQGVRTMGRAGRATVERPDRPDQGRTEICCFSSELNIEERVTENNGNKVSEREYLQRVFGTGDNQRNNLLIDSDPLNGQSRFNSQLFHSRPVPGGFTVVRACG